jgi:hypothetical protein
MAKRELEVDIEREVLAKAVVRARGLCLKLKFLCRAGAPDRLVLLPGGRFFFVEMKTTTGKLEASQELLFPRLEKLGFQVHVLHGPRETQAFIESNL